MGGGGPGGYGQAAAPMQNPLMAALMGMGGGPPVPPNQMMIPHLENIE
jgi:hypothetical protein